MPATRLKICRHLMPFTNILCLKTYKTSQTRHAGRFQFKKLNHFACFFGFTSRLLKPTCTCLHMYTCVIASSHRRIVASSQTNKPTAKPPRYIHPWTTMYFFPLRITFSLIIPRVKSSHQSLPEPAPLHRPVIPKCGDTFLHWSRAPWQ